MKRRTLLATPIALAASRARAAEKVKVIWWHAMTAAGLTLTVDLVEPLGSDTLIHGRIVGGDNETIVVRVQGAVTPAETIAVSVQADQFNAETGLRIDPAIM